MNNDYKILISGDYNVFDEGWNGIGVYMASGNYKSETFKRPIYIGSAVNLQHRIEDDHISALNLNKHPHNIPLQNSWNKHNEEEGFVWWLLEICESEKTLEREQVYLDLYRPFVDEFGGFNISHFAMSPNKGRILSQKIKDKISKNRKGKNLGKNHHFYGEHRTEEVKQKISDKNKNKHLSLSTEFTNEHIPWNKGKVGCFSLETRKKMSIARMGKRLGANSPSSRKVICIETNKIYGSIKDAGIDLKINSKHIGSVCRGVRKTCGGFHWEYLDSNQQESNITPDTI